MQEDPDYLYYTNQPDVIQIKHMAVVNNKTVVQVDFNFVRDNLM